MWVGLIQLVEDLHLKTKTDLLNQKKEFCQQTTFGLKLQLFAGSPAYWSTLQILDLPSFLKINQ